MHIQELFNLSNKVAIVTGGATVVIVDKDACRYITGQNILVDGGWTI